MYKVIACMILLREGGGQNERYPLYRLYSYVWLQRAGADPGEVKWVNCFHPSFSEPPSFFFFLIPQILK